MLLHCIIILKLNSTKWFFQRSKQVEIVYCQVWTVWRMCEHPQSISAIFCVVWWALWGDALSWWKISPCWSRLGGFPADCWAHLIRKQWSVVVCIQSNPKRYKSTRISLWLSQKTQNMIFPTGGWTLNFFGEGDVTCYRPLQKREHHSNTRERDKQSSLNTAASLWWISALGTPSATRNLIIIRCSCCMPISPVDVLNSNDVINDIVIITQGMWSTQYMWQIQHIEQFLSFTLKTKNLAVLEFVERPSYMHLNVAQKCSYKTKKASSSGRLFLDSLLELWIPLVNFRLWPFEF